MKKRERADKMLIRQNSKRSEFTEVTGTDAFSNSKYSGAGTSDGASSKRSGNSDRDSERGNEADKKEEADEDAHNED